MATTTTTPDKTEKRWPAGSFTRELRRRTGRTRTATQALNNLTLPLALSSARVYLQLLRAFQHILVAFEDEFEKRRRVYPRLNAVYFKELLRARAFASDVKHFEELGGGAVAEPPPRAVAFVKEMRAILAREPVLVVAYSYALYMGLLIGGARTAPWVRRAYEIGTESDGARCWDFSETIADRKDFRARYAAAIDGFHLDKAQRELIIKHTIRIFDDSTEIFAEIKATQEYSRVVAVAGTRALAGLATLGLVAWMWAMPFRWAIGELIGGVLL